MRHEKTARPSSAISRHWVECGRLGNRLAKGPPAVDGYGIADLYRVAGTGRRRRHPRRAGRTKNWVHAQFAWLRENAPIRWMSPDGFEPFWSITRHADIRFIESDKALFINDPRPLLSPMLLNAVVQQLTGRRHLVRSLVTMDDPDHSRYRALTQEWFARSNLLGAHRPHRATGEGIRRPPRRIGRRVRLRQGRRESGIRCG